MIRTDQITKNKQVGDVTLPFQIRQSLFIELKVSMKPADQSPAFHQRSHQQS